MSDLGFFLSYLIATVNEFWSRALGVILNIPHIYLNWNFPILQFEISSLMNWIYFPLWNQLYISSSTNLVFFSSFWARIKYFDGPCLTIYPLSTIYRDIHYQFPIWWIHYSHCCESKRWKPWKISSLFYLIWHFNYPNKMKWVSKLGSWNLIFQTGKKIQFIKLDISNWKIGKIQCK